ncbi:hypothetical protein F8O06_00245 [Pseudoclavibacter sp. CFCC 14310]|uniref:PLDc N-terminal domain-containing protein n=1 Tax=Pseudoclavibacter sp. CFCC 14310 TaxID=2615180 RepID=UPI001300FE44|nr:PLDc N-terminal domain-containing protein [Pseudoclavibacter sp. CFCC 14310]KAB1647056.1 hypothetical protein F8O06_00245 [Pseudoclavibacter sp. CFCC 14310]
MTKKPASQAATSASKTPASKRGREIAVTVVGVTQVALAAIAAADLSHRRSDEVHGPKMVWSLALNIPWAGPLSYFALGRKDPTSLPRFK